MLDKILFIVPTRGRPHAVRDLGLKFDEMNDGNADIHFVVDGDHPGEHGYSLASKHWPVHFQPWRGLSGTLNTYASTMVHRYRWIGFMGDDHRPSTPGFDTALLRALRGIGDHAVAYGPDGQPRGNPLPESGPVSPIQTQPHVAMTWWVMDSQTIRLLGQMVPYVLSHTCVDDYVWQLGYQAGTLHFEKDALIEHLHPVWGKAETDESYELSSYHHNRLADHRKWTEYQKVQLPRDVRLIKSWRGSLLPK